MPVSRRLFAVALQGRPDEAHATLTLRLREIGARLSSDEPDAATQPGRLPDDDIASPQ